MRETRNNAQHDPSHSHGARRVHLQSILIVIPTLNEVLHIEPVVNQLLRDLPEHASICMVIVDGGSTDGTRQVLDRLAQRWPFLHWIDNPSRIQSAGLNLAVRRFGPTADVLIRCDAHASYPEAFCKRLVNTLERTGADSVVVPLDSVGCLRLQQVAAWVSNSVIGTGGSAHRAGRKSGYVDHGHHAAFRMDTFRRVGGYDESFTHNEDAELDCRQRALGARIYLDSEIRIQYAPRSTWRALIRQYYNYGAGRSRTLRRHPRSLRIRQLVVPCNLLLCCLALALAHWCTPLLIFPLMYAAVLSAASLRTAANHRALTGLLAGPVAGSMHTAWAFGLLWGLLTARDRIWRPETTLPLWSHASGGEG